MSPAVVAVARAFSNERPDEEQRQEDMSALNEVECAQVDHRKSKSRACEEADTGTGPRARASSLRSSAYYYDPYHQYCRTGSDFYKSYHLSYQAYCHAPKSKFSDQCTPDPRFYDKLATLRPPTKLSSARARAVRLRRKISEFRNRTSAWIQRLALFTISVTIVSYIFTRSLIPNRIGVSQLPFRGQIFNPYSRLWDGLNLTPLGAFNGHCDNGSFFGSVGPQQLDNDPMCQSVIEQTVREDLFGSSTEVAEGAPFIARNVLLKFYALAFLILLVAVSFICERLFGRKITIQHEDILEEDEEDDDISDLDEDDLLDDCGEDYEEDEHLSNFDLYWDCQPTSIRVPRIPMSKLPMKPPQVIVTNLKISLLYMLPLRLISRIWGWINSVELPVLARAPLYTWYAKTFGCNLEEMLVQDLTQFKNLSEFFRRTLKPGVRPIGEAAVVSPADGRVVQLEQVSSTSGYVGSVKGIYYSVDNFLGPKSTPTVRPGNRLYSCVVYLAPGDYHRFHSPTNWTVHRRRHFSGRLLSVKPSFVAQVPNLFAINERVAYTGEWQHGFFSMTAVGATNVGTVNVFFDPELQTNQFAQSLKYRTEKSFTTPITIGKGDLFGEFNLGSTIVLIYEAPEESVHFADLLDQKVKYGENVCSIA